MWKEAKELAQVIPENRYTGWDIAYINNGENGKWVMIEANPRGQFGAQFVRGKGMKREYDLLVNKL